MRAQTILSSLAIAAALAAATISIAQPKVEKAQPVTVETFARAETDLYFSNMEKEGGFGKLVHRREPASIDNQMIIRLNRDTLYSSGVFDLDAGPVTVTMPDAGSRFMSLMVVNQDHYIVSVVYGTKAQTFTKEQVGTRYVALAFRTFVDPADAADVKKVHALQDAIKVEQKAKGSFEVPHWDKASQDKVRDALLVLAASKGSFNKAFGSKAEVDPIAHLIGTAAGWGGNPDKDASYVAAAPSKNDGKTIYTLTVKDVPVEAFWSISVYNEKGYFEKNEANMYSVNNVTAKKNKDNSVTIQFGGEQGSAPNVIPITPGWNYTVRMYRPKKEILDGSWKFPEAKEVGAAK